MFRYVYAADAESLRCYAYYYGFRYAAIAATIISLPIIADASDADIRYFEGLILPRYAAR